METPKLLGHPITRSTQISLADQIHDILCEEIHAGRWVVNEKLPSMMTIADQCGVSRMPVQQAIERLGEEGYVRQENRSGIYLASKMPEGREPLGIIGIVLLSDPQDEREMEHLAYEQLLVHRFIKEAADRNYQTRVFYANKNQNWDEINRPGLVFDGNVKGIVSLVPFKRPANGFLETDRIPLVFWCEPDHRCAPCVASDYEMAFYELTGELIKLGHKNITPLACPTIPRSLVKTYLSGYRKAMREYNLPLQEEGFGASVQIGIRDTSAIQKFFRSHPGISAFACMSKERSEQALHTLTSMGIQIPKEISVTGTNPPKNSVAGLKISGAGFSPENEIQTCFDLLREQSINRCWKIGTILMAPFIVKGETLAPPKK